ncbi:MAG: heparan-alpha-glucosaminide N-acetyltransferase [Devosia sp.]
MTTAGDITAQVPRRDATSRIALIDLCRGMALLAMALFHGLWDASYLGLIDIGIGVTPGWIAFQRAILTVFLLLAGASLVLAHGERIRWRPFWRRWLTVVGGAALVTLGTYLLLPNYVAYFGVLHAIALFSILALPLLRAPLPSTIAAATAALLVAFYGNPLFNSRALSWIGFFTETPPTTDLVPVFPWFGVMLLGLVAMRLARPVLTRVRAFRLEARPSRFLRLLGRWSLVFYIVHQPLIWGALYGVALLKPNDDASVQAAEFTRACTASCDGEAKFCTAYCQCALDVVTRDDLWSAIAASPRSEAEQQSLNQIAGLCTAMATN